ncbi:hypothetical protein HDU84_008132 [Entophlyctis sp. JEL0112]|nr:hypothetical protein HDU84_008132 [Entophlyctis sp. JEL0112]
MHAPPSGDTAARGTATASASASASPSPSLSLPDPASVPGPASTGVDNAAFARAAQSLVASLSPEHRLMLAVAALSPAQSYPPGSQESLLALQQQLQPSSQQLFPDHPSSLALGSLLANQQQQHQQQQQQHQQQQQQQQQAQFATMLAATPPPARFTASTSRASAHHPQPQHPLSIPPTSPPSMSLSQHPPLRADSANSAKWFVPGSVGKIDSGNEEDVESDGDDMDLGKVLSRKKNKKPAPTVPVEASAKPKISASRSLERIKNMTANNHVSSGPMDSDDASSDVSGRIFDLKDSLGSLVLNGDMSFLPTLSGFPQQNAQVLVPNTMRSGVQAPVSSSLPRLSSNAARSHPDDVSSSLSDSEHSIPDSDFFVRFGLTAPSGGSTAGSVAGSDSSDAGSHSPRAAESLLPFTCVACARSVEYISFTARSVQPSI